MVLSITGTVCTVMVQQYKFSARAAITEDARIGIEGSLCQQLCSLNGPIFDPDNSTVDA